MKYSSYNTLFYNDLSDTIFGLKKQNIKPIAAFDADGTLWRVDLGEVFFEYQIKNTLVPLPQKPWDYYLTLKKKNNDPREAYLWLAQICEGFSINVVRSWAKQAVHELKSPDKWIYQRQKELIDFLLDHQVDVYIVSASITWAIEPGASLLNIPPENVLAVETQIINGFVTQQQNGPITYRQGKTEKLLSLTQGQPPFLACGNTLGDQFLIESATHFKLAVTGAPKGSLLFAAEEELQNLALNQGWERISLNP